MSNIIGLRTFYGIETPRETFWSRTGESLVCERNLNHTIIEGAPFCHACGGKTKKVSLETPAPRFAEICDKSGFQPVKFFELLTGGSTDQGWEWEDDNESGQRFKLHWLKVEAYSSGLAAEDAPHITALAFILDDLWFWQENPERPRAAAHTQSEMALYERAVRDVATIFGVEGEPKLYAQVSYG